MTKKTLARLSVTGLAALTLTMTGCGEKKESADDTSTSGETPTTETAPATAPASETSSATPEAPAAEAMAAAADATDREAPARPDLASLSDEELDKVWTGDAESLERFKKARAANRAASLANNNDDYIKTGYGPQPAKVEMGANVKPAGQVAPGDAAPAGNAAAPAASGSNAAKPAVRPVDADELKNAETIAKQVALGQDVDAGDVEGVIASPQRVDLGIIPTGDTGESIVTLRNSSDRAYTLLKCKSSCGCTTANCKEGLILSPGETTQVEVSMKGGERPTRLTKTVTFLFEEHAPVVVQVTAEAKAFVTHEPTRLDPDQHADGAITLTSADGTPFKIQSMYPPVIEGFPTESAETHTVYLDWETMRAEGHRQRSLLFRLDHPKSQKVMVNLSPSFWRQPNAGYEDLQVPVPPKSGQPDPEEVQISGTARMDPLLQNGQTDRVLEMIEAGTIIPNVADSAAQTPMIKAARWGASSVIFALAEKGGDLEATDKMGRTPLMYACQSKNLDAVIAMLDSGAEIEATDLMGNTALCWAAGFGSGDIVEELLSAGARYDVKPGMIGFTPLIWAAGLGEPKSVELLIAKGADIDAADVLQGATCVMHAVRTNRAENVKLLLDAGAKLEAKDSEGSTPLLVACRNAGPDAAMIRLLVERGADLTARDGRNLSVLDLAKKRTDPRAGEVMDALREIIGERSLFDGQGNVKTSAPAGS